MSEERLKIKMKKSKREEKIKKQKGHKTKHNMEKVIMKKVKSEELKMKPKWFFVIGSLLMFLGVVGMTVGAIFLTNLTIFLIKKQGPGYGRLNMMLNSLPLWIPILAIVGVILGVYLLRKYDFSYEKNFKLIVVMFIVSVIIAGFVVDTIGFNDIWSRRGPMRGFYQKLNPEENVIPRGQVRDRVHVR